MLSNLGPVELLVIALIALLLFGAGRISDIGKGLGEGIRNFKRGLKDANEPEEEVKPVPQLTAKRETREVITEKKEVHES